MHNSKGLQCYGSWLWREQNVPGRFRVCQLTSLVVEDGQRERRLHVLQLDLLATSARFPEIQRRLHDALAAGVAVEPNEGFTTATATPPKKIGFKK